MNIKSTVTGANEAEALAECERGEDVAKRAYEVALQKDLPWDVKSIVERQYQGVKEPRSRSRFAKRKVVTEDELMSETTRG